MKNTFRYIVILLFYVGSVFAQKPELKVFIMAGQSNMTGTSTPLVSELPSYLRQPVPEILIKVNGDNSYGFGPLCAGLGKTATNFGPEITFGRDMLAYYEGKQIALIKYSIGGTYLAYNWRPPSSGSATGVLYTTLVNEITTDLTFLQTSYNVEVVGMCWMQGEADASEAALAEQYETNLTNFISDLRLAINEPNMKFMIGMIDVAESWPYNSIVREAETKVAQNLSNVSVFDTHGLETDGVHYKTQGQIWLGHLFARSFVLSQIATNNKSKIGHLISPNPVSSQLFVNDPYLYNTEAHIISIDGKVAKTCIINNYSIDVSELPQGLYYLKIISIEKVATECFMKIDY